MELEFVYMRTVVSKIVWAPATQIYLYYLTINKLGNIWAIIKEHILISKIIFSKNLITIFCSLLVFRYVRNEDYEGNLYMYKVYILVKTSSHDNS